MNIAIIVPRIVNSGPVNVALDLVNEYIQKDYNVEIFYLHNSPKIDLPFSCKYTKLNLYKRYDFSKFDIVHSHCLLPDLFNAFMVKNCSNKISTLHQPLTLKAYSLNKNIIIGLLLYFLACIAQRYIKVHVVLSEEQKKLSLNALKGRIEIINNGRNVKINNDRIINEIELFIKTKKLRTIGTVSVINKGKGNEQIIRLLPLLKDWSYICVGDGPELSSLKHLALELRVDNRCLFLGYRSDACDCYKYFDVYVMPTRSEGFPLSFIEASANSCPTVLSNIRVLRSIADNNEVVFYELDDIISLKNAVLKCYEYRDFLSKNIRNKFEKDMTATVMSGKYIDLYYSLLRK